MYKVFYLAKEIIFVNSVKELLVSADDLIINPENPEILYVKYQAFIDETMNGRLIFCCGDKTENFFQLFVSNFSAIEAAGGIVQNDKSDLLMIFRFDKWDLPKGKIEKGETAEVAAMREVEEETGIGGLQIVAMFEPTYHIYRVSNRQFLKKTYWFSMKSHNNSTLKPQVNEGITAAKWVKRNELGKLLENTYASLVKMLEPYLAC